MGLLNYLGGRGSSGYGEGSSRHVESDVGGVTVGGVALEEEKSWEQPDPSVDNVPFTSFDEARPSDSRKIFLTKVKVPQTKVTPKQSENPRETLC